jgi:5-methylcytosine-specific restriction endonuclease McrA
MEKLLVDPKSDAGRIIKRLKRLKNSYCKDFYRKWSNLRKELYKTGAYQLFLREVRIRAMYRCQRCPKPGRHVHHKVRVYDDPDRALDVSNGEYLCVACHRKEHAEEKTSGAQRATPKASEQAAHKTRRREDA